MSCTLQCANRTIDKRTYSFYNGIFISVIGGKICIEISSLIDAPRGSVENIFSRMQQAP